ncbi:hypothetical protein AX14_012913 [Amanita brunnescens Koide BX004]|nr:hypothetical protein AX14_012913 [Amanita brunnescens Koide BX004]
MLSPATPLSTRSTDWLIVGNRADGKLLRSGTESGEGDSGQERGEQAEERRRRGAEVTRNGDRRAKRDGRKRMGIRITRTSTDMNTGHVESPPFKRVEMFEKDANECSDVLCYFFHSALDPIITTRTKRDGNQLTTLSLCSAYENPTPAGWSTKNTFANSFHKCG